MKRRFATLVTACALAACAGDVAPPPSDVAPSVVEAPPRLLVEPLSAERPFDDRLPPPAEATDHKPAPWSFDVQRYALDIAVDPAAHGVSGNVTIDVEDRSDGLAELPLDAVEMTITGVHDDVSGTAATFAYDGKTLRVALPEPRRIATKRTFTVSYAARPRRGIYFNDGDPPQVYTQGEMEDSRYWFPCHDYPDDRATHTIAVHAPQGWTVMGAGSDLPSGVVSPLVVIHQFGHEIPPHVSYLTTLVAGDYDVIEERGVVPLQYVVERRDMKFAQANFRKTDAILRFFGDYTGLAYPYPKYAQTCVRNFMFGGMENISATTLTDHTIHPPEWEPAHSSTSLVAHEAAHQWFGDWITCADWSHCWLNEGFATYLDLLFTEHDEGRDQFLWELRGARHGGLGAMDHKRRAVVSGRYVDAVDLFDGHAYAGSAMRIHMLRHLLGDDAFREAVRHYVKTRGLSCVTTDDFRKAVEESSGKDLGWFFDQWFLKPGHPVLKVRSKWDEDKRALIVTVEQTQKAEGGTPAAYRLPLDVEIGPAMGLDGFRKQFELTKRVETFEIPRALPGAVRVDPDSALLARFDLDLPLDEWTGQMLHDPNPARRLDAAEALAGIVRDDKRTAGDRNAAHTALLAAFQVEKFAPLRAALAAQVAARRDQFAADALVAAMDLDADLRVRVAATDALGGFEKSEPVRTALAAHLVGDEDSMRDVGDRNDLTRAAATTAIAKLKAAGAYELLLAQIERPGWHSVVRTAALRGFADLGDDRAFDLLVRFAAPGDGWSRAMAIESLGRLGKGKPAFRDAVMAYLDDAERHVRHAAASALGAIGDPDVVPILAAHFQSETWPSCREALRAAIKACRAAAVESGRLVTVEAAHAHEIRERHAPLRDEAEVLSASLKTLDGDAKKAAEARLKTVHDQMAPLQRELDALGVPVKPKPKPPAPAPAAPKSPE